MKYMKGRKLAIAAMSLLVAGSLLFAGCGNKGGQQGGDQQKAAGAKFTWRLADTHPPDYPTVVGDKKFAELVNERT